MKKRGMRRKLIGLVVSNKMDKTIVVVVERLIKHPLYKKFIKRSSRFKAHDDDNECSIGDTVQISENRPLSKTKRWRVSSIVRKAI